MYVMESQTIRLRNVLKHFNESTGVRGIGTQSALSLRNFFQSERNMYSDKSIYPSNYPQRKD